MPSDQFNQGTIDLQLSGHTHDSQVALPIIDSPLPIIVSILRNCLPAQWYKAVLQKFGFLGVLKFNWAWLTGTHVVRRQAGNIRSHLLHVSNGIGSHFGLRIGVAPAKSKLRAEESSLINRVMDSNQTHRLQQPTLQMCFQMCFQMCLHWQG